MLFPHMRGSTATSSQLRCTLIYSPPARIRCMRKWYLTVDKLVNITVKKTAIIYNQVQTLHLSPR